jgi:hypothetical protein
MDRARRVRRVGFRGPQPQARGDLDRRRRGRAYRPPQAVLRPRLAQEPRGICRARRAAAQSSAEGRLLTPRRGPRSCRWSATLTPSIPAPTTITSDLIGSRTLSIIDRVPTEKADRSTIDRKPSAFAVRTAASTSQCTSKKLSVFTRSSRCRVLMLPAWGYLSISQGWGLPPGQRALPNRWPATGPRTRRR